MTIFEWAVAALAWVYAADATRLGSEDFRTREAAHATLYRAGFLALPAVQAARGSADPEVVSRADRLARGLTRGWVDAPRNWWLAAAAICGPECPNYFETRTDENGRCEVTVNPVAAAVGRAWFGRWNDFEQTARFMGVLRWEDQPGWARGFFVTVHPDENFIWEVRSCQHGVRNWKTHEGRR